ncbi:hypothetical protein BLNAU_6290 [Blattamonas nauphoetae]|uniref:Uncharacterized protein n=1 Tax=Blattamonas nauphoetae TaxID=2049346 RepID=A0ABQ9Y4W4_9EUKA|nr:hypothetical protein BLNAU_6290 [Blattamonas nauphoetae]
MFHRILTVKTTSLLETVIIGVEIPIVLTHPEAFAHRIDPTPRSPFLTLFFTTLPTVTHWYCSLNWPDPALWISATDALKDSWFSDVLQIEPIPPTVHARQALSHTNMTFFDPTLLFEPTMILHQRRQSSSPYLAVANDKPSHTQLASAVISLLQPVRIPALACLNTPTHMPASSPFIPAFWRMA